LIDAMGNQLLLNGDFSKGLASWFPATQYHFLPWHIDNLYLETLIERGLLGALPVGMLVVAALWTGAVGRMRHSAISPFGLSGLIGVLVVGLVSSVVDVPRVAFLYYLLILLFVSSKPRLANENV
jgi:O-antigen ligase